MTTQGCFPTKEDLLAIRQAAIEFIEAANDWRTEGSYAGSPGDVGAWFTFRAVFSLERALNPQRLPWGHPNRRTPELANWPARITTTLVWIRDLVDGLIDRHILKSMAASESFEAWCAANEIPDSLPITYPQAEAFERAVERLGAVDGTTIAFPDPFSATARIPTMERVDSDAEASEPHAPDEKSECPVVLDGPGNPPIVLGQPVERLRSDDFHVISALRWAYLNGRSLIGDELNEASKQKNTPHNLRRLRTQGPDRELWAQVIQMSGKEKRGYRVVWPDGFDTVAKPFDSDSIPFDTPQTRHVAA